MEIQLYNVYEDGKLILKDAKPEQILIWVTMVDRDTRVLRIKS